ncbi:BofC C-terminal domain-containing protein [Peribacillus asahii]|uniref:BofC C-terminal domain-containing protein n=1 Tax=Peribacillus asahii TaxID=228899 RepID=UPI00302A92DC
MIIRILACFMFLFFSFVWTGSAELSIQEYQPVERKVILQREYLDGELSEEKVMEVIGSMAQFQKKYREWQIVEQTKEHLVLHKFENDISPLLKANGYFGMTEDGTLSIFNGKPEYEKVIHTFFQLDVGKLEAYQQEELQQGIPIISKEQFTNLIKEYRVYSMPSNSAH